MTILILFGIFFLFMLLSVPIGIALGLSTLLAIIYSGVVPFELFTQGIITAIDSFPLMAIPFFILAGQIMGRGGISERLFELGKSIVGNRTGGLGIAAVVTGLMFASISGSGPATVAAIGAVMIPAMVNNGYNKMFSTSVVSSAGSLGVILPPSITLIIYGVSSNTSIVDLFIAGIIPGILMAVALIIYVYFYSKKQGYKGEETDFKKFLVTFCEAKWALLLPIIVLGGIYGGLFTPTEAAVIACVYGLIAGLFLYREIKIKDLPGIFADSSITTATILIIVATASAFGRFISVENIPAQGLELLLAISENPIVIMLLLTLFLLVIGTFMEPVAAIVILTPLLLPVAESIGYDPVHFGIIMIVNLAIGLVTPPLGLNIFVGASIANVSIESLFKAIIPFFIVMVLTLLIIIFIPQISLLFV